MMKKYDHVNIYKKILDINDILDKGLFSLKFNNTNLEKEYETFLLQSKSKSRLFLQILFFIVEVIRIFFSNIGSMDKTSYYINMTIGILWFCVFFVHFFIKNKRLQRVFHYSLSVLVGIINAYSVILINNFYEKCNDGTQVRELYIMLMFAFCEISFSYDLNFKLFLFFVCLNLGTPVYVMILKLDTDKQRYKDIISSFLITFGSFIFKKYSSILQREKFVQNYKLNKYFSYCFDLINNMNGLQFTIKNNNIMLYNEIFKKYVKQSQLMRNMNENYDKIDLFPQEFLSINENDKNIELKSIDNKKEKELFNVKNSNEPEIKENHEKISHSTIQIANDNCEEMKKSFINSSHKSSIEFLEANNDKHSKFSKFRLKENIINDFLRKDRCKSSININFPDEQDVKVNMNDFLNNELNKNRISSEDKINFKNSFKKKELKINENKNHSSKNLINNNNNNNLDKKSEIKSSYPIISERSGHMLNNSSLINSNNSIFSNFVNEIGEMYLTSFSKISLNKEFADFQGENLFEVYQHIQKNYRPSKAIDKFEFLGDFYLKEDHKFFQVFFRKHSNINDLSDFLIYDLTEIQQAKEVEFNLKSKFFAKIAHEFKTPINSIIGLIKNLNLFASEMKKNKRDDYNKKLNQIENLSNYVVFLINDVIDYSNLYTSKQDQSKNLNNNCNKENNDKEKSINTENISQKIDSKFEQQRQNMNIKIDAVNLEHITNFCEDISETLIVNKSKEKYVKIINEFDEQIKYLEILSDEFRLKQILLNFISNSVKFTKSGMIKIKSKLIAKSNPKANEEYFNSLDPIEIKISIIDTGIGIKQNDLRSLLEFKDNNMISSSMNYNQEGSGLGLSITKYISDLLNHRIEVSSTYGKGSCFSIILKARLIDKNLEQFMKTFNKNNMDLLNFSNENKVNNNKNNMKIIDEFNEEDVLNIDVLRDKFILNNPERKN